jgi:hypothetical protein
MKLVLLLSVVLFLILVPAITIAYGEWPAYWGHGLLAIVFSLLLVYVKTRYYWEED